MGGQGTPQYYISDITSAFPVLKPFDIDIDLGAKNPLFDFTAFKEVDADSLVVDGDGKAAAYLVGVTTSWNLVLVKLDADGGAVSYAMLEDPTVTVDGGRLHEGKLEKTQFGSAWVYKPNSGNPQIFFSSNDAKGLYKLSFPITLDDDCWVTDGAGKGCSSGQFGLHWRAESTYTKKNDGLNCPEAPFNFCDDGVELDACGVCGGDGIPAGDCDCVGSKNDECGVCGGDGSSCAACEDLGKKECKDAVKDKSCEYLNKKKKTCCTPGLCFTGCLAKTAKKDCKKNGCVWKKKKCTDAADKPPTEELVCKKLKKKQCKE